jgi:hypothetical protein
MSAGEDDDLKLQRASGALLSDLEKLLPRLVRRRQHGETPGKVRQLAREVDMFRACALVCSPDPFNEQYLTHGSD